MEDELLANKDRLGIRMYNVGLGDCIFVRIPDKDKHVHILIDCGNKFGDMDILKAAIKNVEANLPKDPNSNKKLLDLLVVTHPHEDHHKGFEPEYFENIKIKNLWLSPGFCELDEEIKENKDQTLTNKLGALQVAAQSGLNRLVNALPAGETKNYFNELLESLSKKDALAVLNGRAKGEKTLDVENRKYVSTDMTYHKKTKKILSKITGYSPFKESDLKLFEDSQTSIKILAPRGDLDIYMSDPKYDPAKKPGLQDAVDIEAEGNGIDRSQEKTVLAPKNISMQDFDLLRAGIQSNALAAAGELGEAVNNLSVVLLLEWNNYRLLFPGDAEWSGPYADNKANGSWNVMWKDHEKELKDIDFLKVGHHGSENATPWAPAKSSGEQHFISDIIRSLLPVERKSKARAVVSTQRTERWGSIPDPDLLAQIADRVSNTRKYEGDAKTKGRPQPWRTDQECLGTDKHWIDIFFPVS